MDASNGFRACLRSVYVTYTEVCLSLSRVTDEVTDSGNSVICSRKRNSVRCRYCKAPLLTDWSVQLSDQPTKVHELLPSLHYLLSSNFSFFRSPYVFLAHSQSCAKLLLVLWCLSVRLSVRQSACNSSTQFCDVCPFVCLSASLRVTARLSFVMSICPPVCVKQLDLVLWCLSVRLFVRQSAWNSST